MRSWTEFLAAAGVCGTVALASAASFGQAADTRGAPPSVGVPTYYYPYAGGYPDVWWQYRGGPKSTSTNDIYYGPPSFEVYSFEGPNYGGAVGPR